MNFLKAPSAVSVPACAWMAFLREADRPFISDSILQPHIPAASSFALFILLPEDSRIIAISIISAARLAAIAERQHQDWYDTHSHVRLHNQPRLVTATTKICLKKYNCQYFYWQLVIEATRSSVRYFYTTERVTEYLLSALACAG